MERVSERASVIETVIGPLPVTAAGSVLAAEVLLQAAPPLAGNTGRPASEVAFAREPVAIGNLGRLLLGAPNRDDRTLAEADAAHALGVYAAAVDASPESGPHAESAAQRAQPVVVVLDAATVEAQDPTRTSAALRRLSAASGVAIVRRTAIRVSATPADFRAAARAARLAGEGLMLSPGAELAEAAAAVARLEAEGLPGNRITLTGAQRLIGRRREGAPNAGFGTGDGAGVDPDRLEGLIALAQSSGITLCFDELGRIPTVRTVVSDHDIAVAILRCAARGLGEHVTLSCGIRAKHQLTAFGGNGLEFITQQFLPYLGMLGADAALRAAIGGETALRFLQRSEGKAV